MTSVSYIIKWIRIDDSGITWTIRGIDPQGVFYGEWINYKDQRSGKLKGRLASLENSRLQNLLAALLDSTRNDSPQFDPRWSDPTAPYNGLIAQGSYSHPTVLLRYKIGDETSSPASAFFHQIVQFMDPIMDSCIT